MEAIGPSTGPSTSGGHPHTGHTPAVMASASMQRMGSQTKSRPSAETKIPKKFKSDCYAISHSGNSDRETGYAQDQPSLPPNEPASPSSNPLSLAEFSNLPEWQRDLIDLESACIPWQEPRSYRFVGRPKLNLFRSKVEVKARNPADCQAIGYDPKDISGAFEYSISAFSADIFRSLRSARERMERVKQTAVTLAYSFLKTTSADMGGGHDKDELQLLIYECLALLTAFPVAMIHQVQGNTCEPAVTKYCQEVAQRLKRLRNGDTPMGRSQFNTGPGSGHPHGHKQYSTVEYFFELFSLQLETEFDRQSIKSRVPSMAPQYILYNLRNHFENIVDMGNLDDRRTPIMRENIDMLALAARECGIFSKRDVAPVAVLWTIDVCCRAMSFGLPIQHCNWIVDDNSGRGFYFQMPSFGALASALIMSVLSATIMTVLSEMWTLWDPFGEGMNTFSWSLGVATEIDHMLNEFYEHDTRLLVRKHAYMDPSAQLNGMVIGGMCECGHDRPQTV